MKMPRPLISQREPETCFMGGRDFKGALVSINQTFFSFSTPEFSPEKLVLNSMILINGPIRFKTTWTVVITRAPNEGGLAFLLCLQDRLCLTN